MKKLLLLACIALTSCQEDGKLQYIGQEIVDGKVSATKTGSPGGYGHSADFPVIYIQNATTTECVEIPFDYEGRWKVGDSCLLIIEKYKEIPEKK